MATQTEPAPRAARAPERPARLHTVVEVGSQRAGWATILEILEEGMERMQASACAEAKVEALP